MNRPAVLHELMKLDELGPIQVGITRQGTEGVRLEMRWDGKVWRFWVLAIPDAKPSTLEHARKEAQSWRSLPFTREKTPPDGVILVGPFFPEEKLKQLQDWGLGGLDLSGNARISVPGSFVFNQTGRARRFREQEPTGSAYGGAASLVPRLLLRQPCFSSLTELHEAVEEHGGVMSLPTASRAVKRLEEDRVVGRVDRFGIRVLSPGRLLDRLAEEDKRIRVTASWSGRMAGPVDQVIGRIHALLRNPKNQSARLARTGASSASFHTSFATEPILRLYCNREAVDLLHRELKPEETDRFPDLSIERTSSAPAFFDTGEDFAASPVQSWLELRRGDHRQREAADAIRQELIRNADALLRETR